jgi:hypothetical protein
MKKSNMHKTPSLYNEYQNVIDFIAIRGSQLAEFVNGNTVKLTNVKLPYLPYELVGTFDTTNWFRVYINGVFISPSSYEYQYIMETNEIIFTFNLPYQIQSEWEAAITGKFIEL